MNQPLDILAIAAHRDDVEQTCGGTLLKMAQAGHRTGILDLTRGEMGTRGTADDRAREAVAAAKILRASWRLALDIPDGRVENTFVNRLNVARVIRATKPRVVILPYWKGRHPDHYICSTLGYEACFLAGLAKLDLEAALAKEGVVVDANDALQSSAPHRPFKIIYATLYYDVRPTFVVDITEQFDNKVESLLTYKSQFSDQPAGADIFPANAEVRERLATIASQYGLLVGVKYGEPFMQKEVGLVEDLISLPVKSI